MRTKMKRGFLGFVLGLAVAAFIAGPAQAGSLEPSAAPGPTTQIPPAWNQILPAADRFELVMGGAAVLDKETGLVWEQSPDTSTRIWTSAISHCYQRQVGGRKGWRLPTIEELASLVDTTQINPALPSGHPFVNVQLPNYWSAATFADGSTFAWVVAFGFGSVNLNNKTGINYVWCVRGGHGHDAY